MNIKKILAVTASVGFLAACNGGGGSDPGPVAVTTAEGLWSGTTSTSRSLTGIVLGNGTYWMLYSAPNNSTVIAAGIGSPVAVAVDSTGVYWADNGGDISMCKVSESCATTYVLADKLDSPSALALDANYVYWTNQGASDNTGSVMRVAK